MTDTDQVDRQGINEVTRQILKSGHIFREQLPSDFGIDAQIEIKDGAVATGRLIAVQIKAGQSYLKTGPETGFWHRIEQRHHTLWIGHSLPVIIVLCDLENETCHYELVTTETCVKAGKNWKILVPKSQIITPDSHVALTEIASPIVPASDFSISAEKDVSHNGVRRISLDVVVHAGAKPMSKPQIGAIVRAATRNGRASDYSRDGASAAATAGRPVDVVSGFIYLRDSDRSATAWFCRFQWISPNLDPSSRPDVLQGEIDGTGLVIDWSRPSDLPQVLDAARMTKGAYLVQVDPLLKTLPSLQDALRRLIDGNISEPDILTFSGKVRIFEQAWKACHGGPPECDDLDYALHKLTATLGNLSQLLAQPSLGERQLHQIRQLEILLAQDMADANAYNRMVR